MDSMNVNRRSFVRGASLGVASIVAGSALAGSALASEGAPAASAAVDGAQPAAAGAAARYAAGTSVATDAPAWLGEEPVVAPEDITATFACDVLIIGAGCAGIAAAATASDLGLNFIAVDKAQSVAETREYLGAINSQYSTQLREEDPGRVLNEISRYASGKCDRDLIKLWIDNSAEMIDWVAPLMEAAGKVPSVADPGEHETGGTDYLTPVVEHSWPIPYVPPTRNDVLLAHMQEQGDDVWFGYELVRLVHEDDIVTGGIFKGEDGYIEIDAPYVVLATGGYAANPVMMRALQPDACKVVTAASFNAFCDGSGIKAGIWAGGAKQNDPTPMLFDRGAVLAGVSAGYVGEGAGATLPGEIFQLNIGSQPFLKVNRRGERFANESTPYDNMLFATGRQPGGVFCQVFDGNAPEDIKRFGMIGCASYTRMMMEQGMPLDDFIAMDNGSAVMMKADTLEELADMLGFVDADCETFLATCAHYNELFDAQADTDYGKEAYRLSELRTPPFYGCWYGASLLTTLDGLQINAKMQVLDANFEPVSGLYAIGDCSGGFFDTNYPEYLPGLAAGRSVTEGRQLVKMIAASPDFVATERTAVKPSSELDLSAVKDGTYTGTGAGMGGDINVTIEVSGGHISVTDISPNNETQGIGGYEAIADGTYAQQVEAAQGPQIDGVAGATITSKAIEQAVRAALKQAIA
ncbi:MAG: FAD-binding protein [Coriobacteriia bacterium]|nr:FAD-binding protein [Coriobacteriia bacterium]